MPQSSTVSNPARFRAVMDEGRIGSDERNRENIYNYRDTYRNDFKLLVLLEGQVAWTPRVLTMAVHNT